MDKGVRPEIFVGSSTEGLQIARAVQYHLRDVALVSVWNDGVFGVSEGSLEGLVKALDRFDFAILVITPDDVKTTRGTTVQAPRDNVMFEIGLFIGRLGRLRTFVICTDAPDLTLPSDLAGVTIAHFHEQDAARDVAAALGPASFLIRRSVLEQGPTRRGATESAVRSRSDVSEAISFLETAEPLQLLYSYGVYGKASGSGEQRMSWRQLFESTAPYMMIASEIWSLEKQLRDDIMESLRRAGQDPGGETGFGLLERTRNMIKVQFLKLGLIEIGKTVPGGHEAWSLTEFGRTVLLALPAGESAP